MSVGEIAIYLYLRRATEDGERHRYYIAAQRAKTLPWVTHAYRLPPVRMHLSLGCQLKLCSVLGRPFRSEVMQSLLPFVIPDARPDKDGIALL